MLIRIKVVVLFQKAWMPLAILGTTDSWFRENFLANKIAFLTSESSVLRKVFSWLCGKGRYNGEFVQCNFQGDCPVHGQGLQMYVAIVFTFVSIIPSVTSPISDRMAKESGSPYLAPDLGLSLQNSL